MSQRDPSDFRAPEVQYVVAEPFAARGISNRYDFAPNANPCQTGNEAECAKWLQERLTELYNG